jgi:hypothetical protein
MLFDLKQSVTYYVEADGVKSPVFSMKVVELPAVTALEMEYVYPAYTGLAPQKVEVGGDVAAIAGTEVRVKITSSMPTQVRVAPAGAVGNRRPDGAARRHAHRQLQDSEGRLLPRGARGAAWREGVGLAEVHD